MEHVNFTEAQLDKLITRRLSKAVMSTDATGMTVWARPGKRKNRIYFQHRTSAGGRLKITTLGVYPEMSLADARAQYARMQRLGTGSHHVTLGDVWEQWQELHKDEIAASTAGRRAVIWRLYLAPLADRPMHALSSAVLLPHFLECIKRSHISAIMACQLLSRLFRHAMVMRAVEHDEAAVVLDALPNYRGGHFATFSEDSAEADIERLFVFMRTKPPRIIALLLMQFVTLLRSAEVRGIELANIQPDRFWVKTKTLERWVVPITPAIERVIAYAKRVRGNCPGPYLLPSLRGNLMHRMTLNEYLRQFDTKLTVHGIRSLGRMWLQTHSPAKESILNLCLSHTTGDNAANAAYNRGQYLEQRREALALWGDFVMDLADKAGLSIE